MINETYGPQASAWAKLEEKVALLGETSIASMFADDPMRGEKFSREAAGIFFDFSRQRLSYDIIETLIALAEEINVKAGIERMFSGEHVNNTEDRPAMHVALRRPVDSPARVDGEDVMPFVGAEQEKMRSLVNQCRAGQFHGHTGKPITDVVNIGIGGSYIGPLMATEALAEYQSTELDLHFISGVGGVELSDILEKIDVETSLFIVCSKSFTTSETLLNAQAAREWVYSIGGERAIEAQFVAVSSNNQAMNEFGIAEDKIFSLPDWVGGRYSIWSGVGLALALKIGWECFEEFLAGAHEMDKHFLEAPTDKNLPILLALIGIWNRNFLKISNHAILPYHHRLRFLPAYFQQLEMESNGKSVRRNGEPVQCDTCPIIWGELGSNAQHSFYQLLHQGTEKVAIDFFLPVLSGMQNQEHHDMLAANCLAQSWALAEGDFEPIDCSPHQSCPGDCPSNLIIFERIDPATLGSLIALYEHKVYVQGLIWDVNSFDQWGVQLGKRLVPGVGAILSEQGSVGPPVLGGALTRLRKWTSGPGFK